MKTKLINISIVAIILMTGVLAASAISIQDTRPVYAAGTDNVTINSDDSNDDAGWSSSASDPWATVCLDATPNTDVTGSVDDSIGWTSNTVYVNEWTVYHSAYGFDVSAIPAGVTVTDIQLQFYCISKTADETEQQYFAVYEGDCDGSFAQEDALNWYPGADRISQNIISYDNINASEYFSFDIQNPSTGSMEYVTEDADGWVWFYLLTTNHATVTPPAWVGTNKKHYITLYNYEGTYKPRLVVTYIEEAADRTAVEAGNAAVDTSVTGYEVTDNITWSTPRLAYADEDLIFWVNGESGAAIDLDLIDGNGTVLDTKTDSIRVDGKYEWVTEVNDAWYGFIRVVENNEGVSSDWGYVMPAPDDDQELNYTFAVNTEYPQYNYDFSRYVKYENDIMAYHWKTNIGDDEHDDFTFEIWGNGDNVTPFYSEVLGDLDDDYFEASANNTFMTQWRYLLMTPNVEGSGFDDHDGLIIDMGQNYGTSTQGFLQPVFNETGVGELTTTHSSYWYIPTVADGVIFSVPGTAKPATDIKITLQVGGACQIVDNLGNLNIAFVNENGTVIKSSNENFNAGSNTYTLETPEALGVYEVRFTFSAYGQTWSYIHDEPITIETRLIAGGLVENIEQSIREYGMDNPAGYWLLLLLGMVVLFLLAYKSPTMRVALPLVLLGAFLTWQFIDAWLIIVLALGAGVVLFALFRHMSHGSGTGGGEG